MLFTEPGFLFLFLPVLLGLYWTVRPTEWRNLLLVIASVIFYAKGGGAFTWLILGSIAFNYVMAIGVGRARDVSESRAKALVTVAVAVNLAVLVVFKYANFLVHNVNLLLGTFEIDSSLGAPGIVLPIGISFFTFHAISYVVDVYRRAAVAQKSPVHAALYLLLFPQLIAGPIIRYREIADQLARRVIDLDGFAEGVRRFIVGLGKKMLIANVVAVPADRIFAMPPDQVSAAHAWLAVVCYTLQIYFDFSGYSDMAIGLGRMFGFRFPENFRWPYIAGSVQDFWRRWHISLSSWFRDYVYVPLGGNRASPARVYLNLVTVFFLCGLWHGASWSFVVWGLYHGMFLAIERMARDGRSRGAERGPGRFGPDSAPTRALVHVYTLIVVMVGWVFFRAETLTGAIGVLKAMAGLSPAFATEFAASWYFTPDLWLALASGIIGSAPVVPAIRQWLDARIPGRSSVDSVGSSDSVGSGPDSVGSRFSRIYPTLVDAVRVAALSWVLAASILQVAAGSYSPFIYFRF